MVAGLYRFAKSSNVNNVLELLEKALTLSRSCMDTDTQCSRLTSIADIRRRMGDTAIGLTYVNEARRLANLSGNGYEEARALWIAGKCTTRLGDYQTSIVHLHRAKEILGICGMLGGLLDSNITVDQAQVHLLKSEYTEARIIHTQSL